MRSASLLVVLASTHPPTVFLACLNIIQRHIFSFLMYAMDQFVLMGTMQIQAVGYALNAPLIVQHVQQALASAV